jgi:predicted AlkP superfamily pyrophosphatase or phosphodiesterase
MYDPEFQAYFRMSLCEEVANGRWWGGEPVWATAARHGQKSATMFWPGSEAEIKGVRPNYWHPYDEKALPSREARVGEVLRWLDLPRAERPTWIAVYFSDADDAGHSSGPDSAEVVAAIEQLDAALGLLLTGLQERGILDQVNLIVTADHGMAATSRERVIFLDDYLDLADADILEATPVLMVRSRSGHDEGIYRALRAAKRPMRVYRKEELPGRYRLKHRRVPPVVAVADEGWSFTTRKRFQARPNEAAGGNHGYDDRVRSMRGFFVARGPSFRQAARAKPFRNIHLYELMCYLLRIPPAPNDGSLREVRRLLRAGVRRDHDQASTPTPFRRIERSSFVLDKVE